MKDLQLIKEIEKRLGLNLKKVKAEDINKGILQAYYTDENSNVTGLRLDRVINISAIKNLIHQFNNLNHLSLYRCQLKEGIFLAELKDLSYLSLSYNNLSDLSFLAELKDLSYLDLDSNSISDLSPLAELKGLSSLDLDSNNIRDISSLAELKALSYLDLANNNIRDISFLAGLKDLSSLDLANNEIKEFPVWLAEKGLKIEIDDLFQSNCISLAGNPLETPPKEMVKQGNRAIIRYFKEMEDAGTDHIYEAKLLILGEPGAGKTSFARKLLDINAELPKEEDTTRGIDVLKWKFPYTLHGKKEKMIRANIWDFGGQAIYKATHRFFLSHRSFYAIIADARKEDTDFYYWMHIVELFGEDSPVIIVINKKENRKRNLPYDSLRKRFDMLKDKKEVNLKIADAHLNDLVDKLQYEISHLKHIGDPIPANWKKIREKIAELENDNKVISVQTFRKICVSHQLTDKEGQDSLAQFFHDLGVFLHFQDHDLLSKCIFLDKEWILDGAYQILEHPKLVKKHGRFVRQDIKKIFKGQYSEYINELIAIMRKFYLLYEKDEFLIAPQLLAYDPPEYDWYNYDRDNRKNVQFQFKYDLFMPIGILWQFIIEMKDEIKKELVWRYGVILDFKDTEAEIIEDPERNLIKIKVSGLNKEDVRAIIIRKIEEINRQFKKLKPKKLIPCVCEQCKNAALPHLFPYDTIINAKNQQMPVQCYESFLQVQTSQLLSGIEFLEKQDRRDKKTKSEADKHTDKNVVVNITNNLDDPAKQEKKKKEPAKKKRFAVIAGIIAGLGVIGGFITWLFDILIKFQNM